MGATPGLVGTGPAVTAMSEAVQDAWLAFVRGEPPWTAYDDERRTTMLLGAAPATAEHHRREQLDVWEGRYPAAG
jgi:para-nitrobenzyl esterase